MPWRWHPRSWMARCRQSCPSFPAIGSKKPGPPDGQTGTDTQGARSLPYRDKVPMALHPWRLLKQTTYGFIEDGALSRGAAIAFYAVTSIGPVLLLVVAVAGLA